HCDKDLSVGDGDAANLLVEGDNLAALKALLPFYAGSVKCIYIDPPYNTGNEGWIYNDNVRAPEIVRWLGETVGREAEDLSRHDKWLCMMYPRLVLLRQMLREDGAIFISIDDNEVHHLRALCDEIFGSRNFVANIIWQKNYAPKGSARHFSESHDHILIYAKDAIIWERNLVPRSDKQDKLYKNPDKDPRGLWRPNNLAARNSYSLGTYAITTPSGRVIEGPPKGSYWRVSKQKLEQMDKDGRIWWGHDGKNVPAPKIYLSEVQQGVVPFTIWPYDEVGHTQEAKKELISILPDAESVFITPKPTRLIKRILQLATDKDSLVLDSFIGSGTTGQAVLSLNAEDGGTRRFIGVEMEPRIARPVTRERLKRVIEGYGEGDKRVAGLGGGFRFCTLGESLLAPDGQLRAGMEFWDVAHFLFFSETGRPLPQKLSANGPFLGACENTGYFLWLDGALDAARLAATKEHRGPKVLWAPSCRLSRARLDKANAVFKQLPYEMRLR
ncbi:MAG: adenine-specific DNA-methyltransferase, partial [Abditibacteriota bacterium]|nr:adenine-specific DNA-methyltransferase [Abditibacteriota bacterium]